MAALKKKSASKSSGAKQETTGSKTVSLEDIKYWDKEIEDAIPQDVINRGIIQSAYKGTPQHQCMLGLAFLPFSREHAETWLGKAAQNNDAEAQRILDELAGQDSDKYIIIWWTTRNFSNSIGSPRISILNRATDRSLNKYVYRNAIVLPFSGEDEDSYDECFDFIRDNVDDQIIPTSDIICAPIVEQIDVEEDSIFEDFEVDLSLDQDEEEEDLDVEMTDVSDEDSDDEEPKFTGGVEGMMKLGLDMTDPFRQFDYGKMIWAVDNDPEGIKWMLKAAKQGYADAEAMIGQLYIAGNGVPEDISKAVRYLTRAAEKGHAEARYALACCFLNDDNPQYSIDKGEHWLTLAAEQGNEDALDLLHSLNDPTESPCKLSWWSLKEFGTDSIPISTIDWNFDFDDGIHAKNQTIISLTCKEFMKLQSKECLFDYIKTNLDPDILKDNEMKIEEFEE